MEQQPDDFILTLYISNIQQDNVVYDILIYKVQNLVRREKSRYADRVWKMTFSNLLYIMASACYVLMNKNVIYVGYMSIIYCPDIL